MFSRIECAALRWKLLTRAVTMMVALLPVSLSQVFSDEGSRPNVVVILCDNLGYGDVGCFNPRATQPTPAVDQMAKEGMKFTHAYSAAPVCTPSRAALLTGCYPQRVGLDLIPGQGHVLRPVSAYGLHPNEMTLAEVLKSQGYATLCVGKWHLGDQPEFLPTQQGFDEYFGIPYSDDMKSNPSRNIPAIPLMEGERVIEANDDLSLFTQRGTERCLRFIEQHRNDPFFIYLSHVTPGSTKKPPVSPEFRNRSGVNLWSDSVLEIDWSTEQILKGLRELGIEKNTLVIWTSDNGAPFAAEGIGSNLPLRGNAYSVAEGGMRMPFIAWWPGRIPAGVVSTEMISLMDVLPTVAGFAGADVPSAPLVDGCDIRALLLGQPGAKSPHQVLFYYYTNHLQAVRSGPWKLYLASAQKTPANSESDVSPSRLYHLIDDPSEEHDVSKVHPEVTEHLLSLADTGRAQLGDAGSAGQFIRKIGRVDSPVPQVLTP